MPEVVEVMFKGEEKGLYTNQTPVILRLGDHVVVEADKGEDMGRVILKGMWVSKKAREAPMRKIVRKASKEDMERRMANLEKETEAFQVCRDRIEERELKMKLVDVECRFDGNRITFYFTADKRVDFRELVKDLAAIYRTRIELRQIGVRDEAKRIGGFGSCGRKFCCTAFLREFEPVTLKMAKEQHLSLSPTKISGACGRLMCCLMYEVDMYRECLEKYPRVGAKTRIGGHDVQVTRVDIFREGVFVQDNEGGERYVSLAELRACMCACGKGAARGSDEADEEPEDDQDAVQSRGVKEAGEADDGDLAWGEQGDVWEESDEATSAGGDREGRPVDEGSGMKGDPLRASTVPRWPETKERIQKAGGSGGRAEESWEGRLAERADGEPRPTRAAEERHQDQARGGHRLQRAGADHRPQGPAEQRRLEGPRGERNPERAADERRSERPEQARQKGPSTENNRRGTSAEGRRHDAANQSGRNRQGGGRGRRRWSRNKRHGR